MRILLATVLLAAPLRAQAVPTLVVTGVGGEPKYTAAFVEQAGTLIAHLVERHGFAPADIVWLAEAPEHDPQRISGRSTRERVVAELQRLAKASPPDGRVLVVFIGHGSDAGEPKVNLPGPDLGAIELRGLLDSFQDRLLALVFAASASGGFVDQLQGPNRIVVTATKTGFERNETVFGKVFAEAFAGSVADTDKDGRLSLAEVFAFATREVERIYDGDNRLQTEHARLSDSTLAGRFVFGPGGRRGVLAEGDSVTARLLARKAELERSLDALRARRSELDPAEYDRRLEALVVELAGVNREIRERGGGNP